MPENPILYVLLLIVLAVLVIMGLAFVVSLLVSAASRQYSGRTRARSEERIVSLLPCENCGACGRPDCRAFAEDVLYRGERPAACTKLSEPTAAEISAVVAALLKQMEPDKTDKKTRKRKV